MQLSPSYKTISSTMKKMALYKRGVLSWANDNLIEFCYLIVHEIWSDKRAKVAFSWRDSTTSIHWPYFYTSLFMIGNFCDQICVGLLLFLVYYQIMVRVFTCRWVFMVFNTTFSNISVILWQSVLWVDETGENHQPVASHWQTLSHCIEYTLPWTGFKLTTLVVIGSDYTGSCKCNYHTTTTKMTPHVDEILLTS